MSKWIDQIESYEKGEMSVDQQQAFEKLLANDLDLQREYESYQHIQHALDVGLEDELRKHLQTKTQSPVGASSKVRSLTFGKWAVAASIAAMMVLGFWFLQPDPSSDFIADHYFERFEVNQSRGANLSKSLLDGFDLIKEDQLDSAIVYYSTLITTDSANFTAHFILGDLYQRKMNYSAARNQMEVILTGGSFYWKEKAQLNYLILSLNTEWNDQANGIMSVILSDNQHPYREQANKIQQQRLNK